MAANTWDPKFPQFARPDRAEGRSGPIADPDSFSDGSDGSVPWEEAPASSHLWGWRLYTRTDHRFLRTLFPGVEAILYIRFRPSGQSTGHSEYAYEFRAEQGGETEARRVLARLGAARQPWKEVGIPDLVNKRVPYYPTHK